MKRTRRRHAQREHREIPSEEDMLEMTHIAAVQAQGLAAIELLIKYGLLEVIIGEDGDALDCREPVSVNANGLAVNLWLYEPKEETGG